MQDYKEFYESVKAFRENGRLPKYIQLVELMAEHDIDKRHDMYNEMMEAIESEMEVVNSYGKEYWKHPEERLPMTAEEYLIELYLLLEEGYKIPKEFNNIVREFKNFM
ncbi:hypothetical protein [Bacillus haynesii]|uniref:hypothetical protein n=1 Tax=Bacillus haynesii TaxID=1925021 RepID=UPI0022803778|nr:hypothetical protein [Bacillus haynesii]MCY7861590.1 hypothetical protein [Bacillus haynesii]MCY9153920.1 hypothetical protein [Bacillus haynesii]